MKLIRVGDPIPNDHYVEDTVQLAAIDPAKVKAAYGVIEDVTSHSSGEWREYESLGMNVEYASGRREFMPTETLRARMDGGGEFYRCLPNDDHVCPLTEEQAERAKDEIDRWDYDDYDDYEGDEEDE